MAKLTALVHTKNASETLGKCLQSLQFADQIIVIDMESSDDSRQIARHHGATVLKHEDTGYVEPARNFALQQVKTEWTLILDADEEVPLTLQQELLQLMTESTTTDVYYLPRKNMIFDKWIEHTGWWPDYQLRFFKTGKVNWPKEIHAQPKISGTATHLPARPESAIIHYNYQSIEQYLERLNRYTTIEVDQNQNKKEKTENPSGNLAATFTQEFIRRFFAEKGYLDAEHGLALSYLQGLYELSAELKRWQAEGFSDRHSSHEIVKMLDQSMRELRYWIADYYVKNTKGPQRLIWKMRRKMQW